MLGSVLETGHSESHRAVSCTAGVCNVGVGIVIPLMDQAVGEVLGTVSSLLENKTRNSCSINLGCPFCCLCLVLTASKPRI